MKKRKRILLILLAAAAVLAALYFAVVRPIANKKQTTTLEPVALLEGEAYFRMNGNESNQIPVMFPQVDRSDLYEIRILNNGEYYGFTHYLLNGMDFFLMWTEGTEDADGDGMLDRTLYYPELARITENFDYTTLYDETSKIPSLITGSGCVTFKDRVYIRADADPAPTDEEYQTILHRYGLADADNPVGYEIQRMVRDDRGVVMYQDGENIYCTDGSGKYWDALALKASGYDYKGTPTADVTGKKLAVLLEEVKVFVGDLLPDESGYYLRLVGRDVVYTTGTTTVGRIVYQSLSYYIHPRLAQASENVNQSYALFTPSLRVYTGTGAKNDGITKTDTVLFTSSYAWRNGATSDTTGALALGSGSVPETVVDALVASGRAVGETIPLLCGTTVEPHWFLKPNKKTEYVIYAVSAVIRGDEYLNEKGTPIVAGDKAICAYTADGEQAIGLLDLSTAPGVLSDLLVGQTVGTFDSDARPTATVNFSTASTFETALYQVESVQVYARSEAALSSNAIVWDSSDKTSLQTVTLPKTGSRGWVAATYSVKQDGVLAVRRTILCLDGGNATLAEDLMAQAIVNSTTETGKLVLGYYQIPATVKLPADPFTGVWIYRDFKIEGIYGTDETIGVRYVNETERDIFHGGSAYEIFAPASRTVYSVNNEALMDILQTTFAEAKGSETVAVGLTKENFEKYGLDAHAVYFEMPVGLSYRDGTTMDVGIRDRVGFHLYLSERQKGKNGEGDYYYAASDLYGIVVKAPVSECDFSFVDWEFKSSWVDDDLLLLKLTNVRDITFDINYEDLRETHGFAVSVNPEYHTSSTDDVNSRIYVTYVPNAAPTYDVKEVAAKDVETDNRNYEQRNQGGKYYRTDYGVQLTRQQNGKYEVRSVNNANAIGLDEHYSVQRGGAALAWSGTNFEGVGNFTKLITLIYTSEYSGAVTPAALSDAEAARVGDLLLTDAGGNYVLSDDDPAAKDRAVFTLTLTLVDGRVFRLTFYPMSDGRYLLSFEDQAAGVVSREFYMNMGEIKNIVTAVRTIVAGGTVRYDQSYLPEPD